MSSCDIEVETTAYCLLHCPNYYMKEKPFWTTSNLSLEQSHSFINIVLLFGDTFPNDFSNTIMLNPTISYVTCKKRFVDSIFTF